MLLERDLVRGRRSSCGPAWCMYKGPGSLLPLMTDNYPRAQYAYERYLTLQKDFARTKLICEMQEGGYPKDHNGNDTWQRCFGAISRCSQECSNFGPRSKEAG